MPTRFAPDIRLTPVAPHDADELAALRVTAMRESLERIGRFDPERARARFLSTFMPGNTQHIELAWAWVGVVVMSATADAVDLAHLYIRPESQNQGTGAAVLREIVTTADRLRLPLRVTALRDSAANRFYTIHGFALAEQTEFDNHYERAPST
ncbi:MAG TPA: GNAT family N-acetyltransferase [Polyangiaceae bacterium]